MSRVGYLNLPRLYARQGSDGYEYYLSTTEGKVWETIAEEFEISVDEAKKTYGPLEESPVSICE